MRLSTTQIETYGARGFILLEGFFDRETMTYVSDFLDALRDRDPAPNQEAKYYEQSPINGANILVRIENLLGDHNRDLTDRLLCPKTLACLTEVLGDVPVLFKDKVNYKLPGCRPDRLHQDQAAGWNRYCRKFVTMAVAVDPNRKDNAALSFLRSGNYARKLMTEEWQPLTEQDPPYQPEDEYLLVEAEPGDVILFDSYVPHGSPANTSQRPRRNLFLTFNRACDGDMRARYYADKWASYAPNQAPGARTQESFRV